MAKSFDEWFEFHIFRFSRLLYFCARFDLGNEIEGMEALDCELNCKKIP